ncbi:MAG: hypothetical protein Q9160_000620 [Pyrenula sp. 1 TL-2023]
MEFTNDGLSVYHRVLGIYARQVDGDLLRYIGQHHDLVETVWPSIRTRLGPGGIDLPSVLTLPVSSITSFDDTDLDVKTIRVYELQDKKQHRVVGMILKTSESNDESNTPAFEPYLAKIVLSQVWLDTQAPLSHETSAEDKSEAIVDLFDSLLRYRVPDDHWHLGGREYFLSKVQYFTSRGLQIELCLPAFPCKSSNPEKVGGTLPDKGEEMALRRLHEFVEDVSEIYEPGARVWIISDGHVFSDCIGVDDGTVDMYGDKLKELNGAIDAPEARPKKVCFRSLVDLFDLRGRDLLHSDLIEMVGVPSIDHHIDTDLTEDAELCRRILMAGFQPDKASLKAKIDSQDSSLLALYRGFSRFMLEDLDMHPSTQELSRSKRKKLSSKVSFEMILRNQAYSNLVNLIFPDHIRLSIHAHNNAGPKFGVQLLDKKVARAVDTLEADSQGSADLLHIPTPWHNSIAKVEDSPKVHVLKSAAVKEAVSERKFAGDWVEGDLAHGKGGFFALSKTEPKSQPEVKQQDIVRPAMNTFARKHSHTERVSA